ncbi:MAG: hypothetical protein AAGD11_16595 [Planctomycetota bacterium]
MSHHPFSSEVELKLIVGQYELELSHTNHNNVILRDSARQFPRSNAEIVTIVDGVEHRRKVHLPDGIESRQRRVIYNVIED